MSYADTYHFDEYDARKSKGGRTSPDKFVETDRLDPVVKGDIPYYWKYAMYGERSRLAGSAEMRPISQNENDNFETVVVVLSLLHPSRPDSIYTNVF